MIALALVATPIVLYRRWTDPARLRLMAEAYLSTRVDGWVSVGSASFSWSDGVRLLEVAVGRRDPSTESIQGFRSESIVSCPLIVLELDKGSLVTGHADILSIVAQSPTCRVVRDRNTGRTNIAELFLPIGESRNAFAWPRMELRDARLLVVERTGAADRVIEDVTLTVRGGPATTADAYDLFWQEPTGEGGQSRIDLTTGVVQNVRGGLPWMRIGAVMQLVDIRFDGVGGWSDLLGLRGRVRALDYDVGADHARSATIELKQAGVSIPIDTEEEGLDRDERYLTFESVDGTVHLTRDRVEAEFTGLFHGSPCRVGAVFRSAGDEINTLDDVDFDVDVRVTDLMLPLDTPDAPASHRRFIHSAPRLTRFYDRYEPSGRIDLEMSLEKPAGLGVPVTVRHARLTLRRAEACVSHFPYALTDGRGVIEYGPSGVFLDGLTGFHGTTLVRVDGFVDHGGKTAAVQLDIGAEGTALDQALFDAMPSKFRRVIDAFHVTGEADVSVRLDRPTGTAGQRAPWHREIAASFDDLALRYDAFPYPLEHVSGSVAIDNDGIAVRNLQGRRGDARIDVDGVVSWDKEGVVGVDLAVAGQGVPFDDALIAALPDRLRKPLSALHPRGRFDTATTLGWDCEARAVTPQARVFIEDVAIRPDAAEIDIQHIAGMMTIDGGRVRLDNVRGMCQGASIAVSGQRDLDPAGAVDLSIQCRDMALTEELIGALPDPLRTALRTWRINGRIAADTVWKRPAGDPGRSILVTDVRLDDVTLRHDRFPEPFEHVSGRLRIDGTKLTLNDVTATYSGAKLTVSGMVDPSPTKSGDDALIADLRLAVEGLPLVASVRDILPEGWRRAWDDAKPAGAVDLNIEALRCARMPDGADVWTVDGRIALHDVVVAGVLHLNEIAGSVSVEGQAIDSLGGLVLRGDLNLRQSDVLGRRIEDVHGRWSWIRQADGVGRVDLTDLEGKMYGGSVMAPHVRVQMTPPRVTYDIQATAHSVALDRFVSGERTPDDADAVAPGDDYGRITAQLSLSGTAGDPRSRRGWGGFDILDAKIYKLPIIWKILTFLDVTTPVANEAFNHAKARFNVVGDRMDLEGIVLRGSALAFEGRGQMTLPDRHVNIELRPVSDPSALRIPIFSEIIQGAARGIVGLRVTGPLSDPSVHARSLPGVNNTLRDLFVKKKDDRRR